jgi:hypothetical protein
MCDSREHEDGLDFTLPLFLQNAAAGRKKYGLLDSRSSRRSGRRWGRASEQRRRGGHVSISRWVYVPTRLVRPTLSLSRERAPLCHQDLTVHFLALPCTTELIKQEWSITAPRPCLSPDSIMQLGIFSDARGSRFTNATISTETSMDK